ncbi:hypothetical protein Nepgr_002212 [Nepenthes gracilis]|uniref:Uncharacterized protein n=1 Tax=Nepenthes gracilis TaxID=150966 RepID=A0AAD3P6J3_NEPGR|nr:hypothetical protein Nepgr_002212 [Nepenthes gracilis]
MGSFLGKVMEGLVQGLLNDDPAAECREELLRGRNPASRFDERVRVKVRMTKRELQELTSRVDLKEQGDCSSQPRSQLGHLILQGGLEGKYYDCSIVPVRHVLEEKKRV